MSVRWTEEDLARINSRLRRAISAPLDVVPTAEVIDKRRSKYRNERQEWQGRSFDSKHELAKFKEYELERVAGKIRAVVRQVSFQLPGTHRRIRVDFMLVQNNGRIDFVDAKGFATKEWELKRDQVKEAFGITIQTV